MALLKLLAACLAALASGEAEPTCSSDSTDQTCVAEADGRVGQALLQGKKEAGLIKERAEARQLSELGLTKDQENSIVGLQTTRKYAMREEEDDWLDLRGAYLGGSVTPHEIQNAVDGLKETRGGAVKLEIDLGQVYEIKKADVEWRVCKCTTPGSVIFAYSLDKVDWMTYAEPVLEAWGGKEQRVYEKVVQARYFTLQATDKAGYKWLDFWEFKLFGKPTAKIPNVYGWYNSYKNQENGLDGTEILHLWPYKGKLFGGTGYWMHSGTPRTAEIVRLDCPFCDWTVEQSLPYAGRVEVLKSIQWTTDAHGSPLGVPYDQLIAGYYVDWAGEGRCYYSVRDDATSTWTTEPYWKRSPFTKQYFSARAMTLYRDSVTGVDRLFFSTGMDGIISGTFDQHSATKVSFPTYTESGRVETRPLAITVMDGKIYFTASSYIKRRVNGAAPSWEKVFDMMDIDPDATVDEAVGGIRGLGPISNAASPTGSSLLFAWAPNTNSRGCMYRLDPNGDGFAHYAEVCTTEIMKSHLGSNKDNLEAFVTYVIANYNFPLEVHNNNQPVQIIGNEALLYSYSTYEFPIDHTQVFELPSGKRIGFLATGGYLVRKGPNDYEARSPGGPRYNPTDIFPKQVAVRCYAQSPWGDDAVYMGGYDCNHFPSLGTAWIQRASVEAAHAAPVPCQKELGCGHVPGEAFKTVGCDVCSGAAFDGPSIAFWDGSQAISCQALLDWLNLDAHAEYCPVFKANPTVAKNCCGAKDEVCNFCEGTGKTFQADNNAGSHPSTGPYTCISALNYMKAGAIMCPQAQQWWKGVCCA